MHPVPATLAVILASCTWSRAASADPYRIGNTSAAPVDVAVEPDDGGGTMHFAKRVTLRGPSSTALSIVTRDDALEKDCELVPLFDREIALPARPLAVVLLGWSSTGSGMETVHAWIVRAGRGAPEIVAKLAWTTDRSSAGFFMDLSQSVRLGLPWTFDGPMHDPSEWRLDTGARRLALDDVKKLPFEPTTTPLSAYRPPFGIAAWHVGTSVAWLVPTPQGFRLH